MFSSLLLLLLLFLFVFSFFFFSLFFVFSFSFFWGGGGGVVGDWIKWRTRGRINSRDLLYSEECVCPAIRIILVCSIIHGPCAMCYI